MAETFDHLRRAASHGVSGIGAVMAPRIMVMAPRVIAARSIAVETAAGAAAQLATRPMRRRREKERMMARKRRTYGLASLLAIGAAVGAAGALVGRRRRQSMWQEYDATAEPSLGAEAQGMQAQGMQAPLAPSMVAPGPGPVRPATGVGSLAEQARGSLDAPEDSAFDEDAAYESDAIPPIYEPSRERRS